MIGNCEGCKFEYREAFRLLKYFHLATSPDYPMTYPFGKHHFGLMMVDDNGNITVR